RHFHQVAGYGLTLSALFRFDSRIGTHSVNQCPYRLVEFFGQPHQAQGFAISLGVGHSDIPELTLFGIFALLMPNNHQRLPTYGSETADNRLVIPHSAITMKLDKLFTDEADIVKSLWTVGVARHLHLLP